MKNGGEMKTINFIEIENYQVITSIDNATPDPEETSKKVETIILQNPGILQLKTREELLVENVVWAHLGKGQINVADTEGENLKGILNALKKHEKLLLSGDIIVDFRDQDYWLKQSGTWIKYKIEGLGEPLPAKAVLPENLSAVQQQEIAEQTETERLANLTPEEKAKEKESALAAAKQRIRIQKEEAEIAAEPFDAKAEFQAQKAKIEEKYR
jgi:hypothetical protein